MYSIYPIDSANAIEAVCHFLFELLRGEMPPADGMDPLSFQQKRGVVEVVLTALSGRMAKQLD